MAALPLNTASHFVFYYRFCNSLDFYCALHPKNLFHFQGLFLIIKEIFSKFKDNSRTNCILSEFQEFSRTKVIFKDFSRSVRTLVKRSRLKIECRVDLYSSRCMHDPSFMALVLIVSEKMALVLIVSEKMT